MPVTRSQSRAQDSSNQSQTQNERGQQPERRQQTERGRPAAKAKHHTNTSKSKLPPPTGTPTGFKIAAPRLPQIASAVSSPCLSEKGPSSKLKIGAGVGGSSTNLPAAGTASNNKVVKEGSLSKATKAGSGSFSNLATAGSSSKANVPAPLSKPASKGGGSSSSSTTLGNSAAAKLLPKEATSKPAFSPAQVPGQTEPSSKFTLPQQKPTGSSAPTKTGELFTKPASVKPKPESKPAIDEPEPTNKPIPNVRAESQEQGPSGRVMQTADTDPVPIPTAKTGGRETKAKAGRTGRKNRDGENLRMFLTEYSDVCSSAASRNEMMEVHKKNTLELEALLEKATNKKDEREDVFKNSPMMVKAAKSGRKVKKIKATRVMTPGFNPTTPLRVATLKDESRVTRAKLKMNNVLRKRMRSPDTDVDSPVRVKPTVTVAPKFNFMDADSKKPVKKKLKERGDSVKLSNDASKKAKNVVKKIKSPVPPPVVEAPTPEPEPVAPAVSVPVPTVNNLTFNANDVLDATYVVPLKTTSSTATVPVPKAEITVNLPSVQKKAEPVPFVVKKERTTFTNTVDVVPSSSKGVVKESENDARLLSSVVQDLSGMILNDDGHEDEEMPMSDIRTPDGLFLLPPTPKAPVHQEVKENKENKLTCYDITLLADYDEEALEHRADKVVPDWALDQEQIDYLLYRYSAKFVDEVTDLRIFPRGTQYSRFCPVGTQKFRPVAPQNTIKK